MANVDLGVPSLIIEAYKAGVEEKRRREQLQFEKELKTKQQEEAIRQFNEKLKQEQEEFKAQQKLREATNAIQQFQAKTAAQQYGLTTGQAAPGVTPVATAKFAGSPESEVQTFRMPPEFGGETFTVSPGAYAQRQREILAPKTEAQISLEKAKAEAKSVHDFGLAAFRQKFEQEQQSRLFEQQKALEKSRAEDAYNRAIDVANIRAKATKSAADPFERPLSPDEAERFNVPYGTLRRDVVGKTPGVKLTTQQTTRLKDLDTLEQVALDARKLSEETNYSFYQGPLQGALSEASRKVSKQRNPNYEKLRTKLANLEATIAKARAGTSFTPNEQKLLENYVVTASHMEAPETAKQKLDAFIDFIRSERTNLIGTAANRIVQPSGSSTSKVDDLVNKYK